MGGVSDSIPGDEHGGGAVRGGADVGGVGRGGAVFSRVIGVVAGI